MIRRDSTLLHEATLPPCWCSDLGSPRTHALTHCLFALIHLHLSLDLSQVLEIWICQTVKFRVSFSSGSSFVCQFQTFWKESLLALGILLCGMLLIKSGLGVTPIHDQVWRCSCGRCNRWNNSFSRVLTVAKCVVLRCETCLGAVWLVCVSIESGTNSWWVVTWETG